MEPEAEHIFCSFHVVGHINYIKVIAQSKRALFLSQLSQTATYKSVYFNYIYFLFIKSGFVLFDLILYVHSTIFQLCWTGLPGFNQY